MRKITKLEIKNLDLPKLKRVAAYARVSVERGRTLHSYSAQVSYYNDLSNLRIVDRALHAKSHTMHKRTVIKRCIICNKEYFEYPSRNRKYCSRECYYISKRKVVDFDET